MTEDHAPTPEVPHPDEPHHTNTDTSAEVHSAVLETPLTNHETEKVLEKQHASTSSIAKTQQHSEPVESVHATDHQDHSADKEHVGDDEKKETHQGELHHELQHANVDNQATQDQQQQQNDVNKPSMEAEHQTQHTTDNTNHQNENAVAPTETNNKQESESASKKASLSNLEHHALGSKKTSQSNIQQNHGMGSKKGSISKMEHNAEGSKRGSLSNLDQAPPASDTQLLNDTKEEKIDETNNPHVEKEMASQPVEEQHLENTDFKNEHGSADETKENLTSADAHKETEVQQPEQSGTEAVVEPVSINTSPEKNTGAAIPIDESNHDKETPDPASNEKSDASKPIELVNEMPLSEGNQETTHQAVEEKSTDEPVLQKETKEKADEESPSHVRDSYAEHQEAKTEAETESPHENTKTEEAYLTESLVEAKLEESTAPVPSADDGAALPSEENSAPQESKEVVELASNDTNPEATTKTTENDLENTKSVALEQTSDEVSPPAEGVDNKTMLDTAVDPVPQSDTVVSEDEKTTKEQPAATETSFDHSNELVGNIVSEHLTTSDAPAAESKNQTDQVEHVGVSDAPPVESNNQADQPIKHAEESESTAENTTTSEAHPISKDKVITEAAATTDNTHDTGNEDHPAENTGTDIVRNDMASPVEGDVSNEGNKIQEAVADSSPHEEAITNSSKTEASEEKQVEAVNVIDESPSANANLTYSDSVPNPAEKETVSLSNQINHDSSTTAEEKLSKPPSLSHMAENATTSHSDHKTSDAEPATGESNIPVEENKVDASSTNSPSQPPSDIIELKPESKDTEIEDSHATDVKPDVSEPKLPLTTDSVDTGGSQTDQHDIVDATSEHRAVDDIPPEETANAPHQLQSNSKPASITKMDAVGVASQKLSSKTASQSKLKSSKSNSVADLPSENQQQKSKSQQSLAQPLDEVSKSKQGSAKNIATEVKTSRPGSASKRPSKAASVILSEQNKNPSRSASIKNTATHESANPASQRQSQSNILTKQSSSAVPAEELKKATPKNSSKTELPTSLSKRGSAAQLEKEKSPYYKSSSRTQSVSQLRESTSKAGSSAKIATENVTRHSKPGSKSDLVDEKRASKSELTSNSKSASTANVSNIQGSKKASQAELMKKKSNSSQADLTTQDLKPISKSGSKAELADTSKKDSKAELTKSQKEDVAPENPSLIGHDAEQTANQEADTQLEENSTHGHIQQQESTYTEDQSEALSELRKVLEQTVEPSPEEEMVGTDQWAGELIQNDEDDIEAIPQDGLSDAIDMQNNQTDAIANDDFVVSYFDILNISRKTGETPTGLSTIALEMAEDQLLSAKQDLGDEQGNESTHEKDTVGEENPYAADFETVPAASSANYDDPQVDASATTDTYAADFEETGAVTDPSALPDTATVADVNGDDFAPLEKQGEDTTVKDDYAADFDEAPLPAESTASHNYDADFEDASVIPVAATGEVDYESEAFEATESAMVDEGKVIPRSATVNDDIETIDLAKEPTTAPISKTHSNAKVVRPGSSKVISKKPSKVNSQKGISKPASKMAFGEPSQQASEVQLEKKISVLPVLKASSENRPKSAIKKKAEVTVPKHTEVSDANNHSSDTKNQGSLIAGLRRKIYALRQEIQIRDDSVEEFKQKEDELKNYFKVSLDMSKDAVHKNTRILLDRQKKAYQILCAKLRREVRRFKFQRNSLSDSLLEAKYLPYLPKTPYGNSARKPPIGIIGNLPPRSSDYFVLNPPPPTGNHPDSGNRYWWGSGPDLSSHLPPPVPKESSANFRRNRKLVPSTDAQSAKQQSSKTPAPPLTSHSSGLKDLPPLPDTENQSPLLEQQTRNSEARLGDRTCVVINGERCLGVIKYVGIFDPYPESGLWAGIKLDRPLGKHDGVVRGKRYFTCEENHGLFVKIGKIIPVVGKRGSTTTPTMSSIAPHEITA